MSVVRECFFWYRLTRVVPDKFHRAVKRLCVCVCVLKDVVTSTWKLPKFEICTCTHACTHARMHACTHTHQFTQVVLDKGPLHGCWCCWIDHQAQSQCHLIFTLYGILCWYANKHGAQSLKTANFRIRAPLISDLYYRAACKVWWKLIKNCERNHSTSNLFTNTKTNKTD